MTGQEPPGSLGDLRELLDAYLDHYRDVVLRKLDGLPEEELRHSRVPSGWTPLGLLVHLTWVERRWLVWGMLGEPLDEPWGDRGPDDGWWVPEGWSAERVRAEFAAMSTVFRMIISGVMEAQLAAHVSGFAIPVAAQRWA